MADKIYIFTEKGFNAMVATLKDLKQKTATVTTFFNSFPATGDEVVAVVNRKAEPIAPAGNYLLYQNTVVAATLQALETGRIPVGLTTDQYEQIRKFIGEERFNELDSSTTLEAPESVELTIAKAIEAYDERKANLARVAEEMKMAEQGQIEDVMALDVEESKKDDSVTPQIKKS